MPFVFEQNAGQAPVSFRFLARGRGYSLGLAKGGAIMSLSPAGREGKPSEISIRPVGGNPNPVLAGTGRTSGVANHFVGNDQSKWIKGAKMFAGARYKSVYPGIDMLYRGKGGQLEYDFVLAPGADPSKIAVAYEGAQRLLVDGRGDLLIRTPAGDIRQRKPFAYQTVRGHRRPIAADYKVSGATVSLQIGRYDRTRRLVIDPIVNYGSYIGGKDDDQVTGLAVDPDGLAYLVGTTNSMDFPNPQSQTRPVPILPPPNDAGQVDQGPRDDVFVAKFDTRAPGQSGLKYVTFLAGSKNDNGYAIAVDSRHNAFVAGRTLSADFPSRNAFAGPAAGSWGFVAQLDPGGGLGYSSRIGYNRQTVATGIAVMESAGDSYAYVTGFTSSDGQGLPGGGQATFPDGFATEGAYQTRKGGSGSQDDAFVIKVNPALGGPASLLYSTYVGGNGSDTNSALGGQIAVDQTGVAYLESSGDSTDFPTRLVAPPIPPPIRLFVAKLSSDGRRLLGAKSYGNATAGGIVTGAGGNLYLTGSTPDAAFDPGGAPGVQPRHAPAVPAGPGITSALDAFVIRATQDLEPADFTLLGGKSQDQGEAVALDKDGNVYLTGSTGSPDFPRTQGPPVVVCPADSCSITAFVSELSPNLAKLVYSTPLSSNGVHVGSANGTGIAVSEAPSYSLFVAGSSGAPLGTADPQDLPVSASAYQPKFAGNTDGFVTRWVRPTVTSVSQVCGPVAGGTALTITGQDFVGIGPTGLTDGITEVKFGDAQLARGPGYVVTSDTSITAVAPPHPPAKVHVTVSNGLGPSQPSEAAVFTYPCPGPVPDPKNGVPGPSNPSNPPPGVAAPVVAKLDPSVGPVEGGTKVRITGSGLTGAKTVRFGEGLVGVHPCPLTGGAGKAPCFSEQSANEILAFSPTVKTAASVHVTVETDQGVSAPTAVDLFNYQEGAVPAKADLKSDPVGGQPSNRPAISVPVSNTTSYVPGPPGGSAAFVASPSVTTAPALSSGFSSAVSASVAESSSAVSMNAGAISFVPENSPEERAAPSAADTYNVSASRQAASLVVAGGCFVMTATMLGRRRRWAARPDVAAPAFARAI